MTIAIDAEEEADGKIIGEPTEEPQDLLRQARELIPVAGGAKPLNLAQQVDFARTMAKARASVPDFLRDNPGDCLAIIDIAGNAGLSPYMLAMKAYVDPKSKKLAFESQAYHALAMPWLKGDFQIDYEGDGDDTICIVTGTLKHDPKPREHRSEPLGKARPLRNADGVIKGSPLWNKKPRVQLAYDTIRDWVRLYCPRATLGIYTPDEIAEYNEHIGPERAKDVTGLRARLSANGSPPTEGFAHDGGERVASELDNVAPDGGAEVVVEAAPAPAPAEQSQPEAKPKAKRGRKKKEAEKIAAIIDPDQVKTAADYIAYAENWIGQSTDFEAADYRWSKESDLRDSVTVPIKERSRLFGLLEAKFPKPEIA